MLTFKRVGLSQIFLVLLIILAVKLQYTTGDSFRNLGTQTCGIPQRGAGNIIGGSRAQRGAYPWIVALFYRNEDYFCGGSIVTSRKVVTAAHCIQDKDSDKPLSPSDLTVKLGIHDLKKPTVGSRISAVQRIFVHPDWNTLTSCYDADIAVLVLEEKITFNQYIQPICFNNNQPAITEITHGLVVGYGKSENEKIQHETIPKVLELPIHDNLDCFFKFPVLLDLSSKRTLCAGNATGTGVCKGDSGSGLVVKKDGAHFLRGIVSASPLGDRYECDVNKYSIFTDAIKFYDWIKSIDVRDVFYDLTVTNRTGRKFLSPTFGQVPSSQLTAAIPSSISTVSPSATFFNNLKNHSNYRLLNSNDCGLSTSERTSSSGMFADLNEFPWAVLLGYSNFFSLDMEWSCGGSLITSKFVLTATHCIFHNLKIVRLGEYTKSTFRDCDLNGFCADPVQDIAIAKMIRHPKYSLLTKVDNIALLKLAYAADTTRNNVRTICLPLSPESDIDVIKTTTGRLLTVAGWGKIGSEDRAMSNVLKRMIAPFVENLDCKDKFRKVKNIRILNSFLCAGGDNRYRSGQGDGGSGITAIAPVDEQMKYVLYGILSAGIEPTALELETYPDIFTNIKHYLQWILDNMS